MDNKTFAIALIVLLGTLSWSVWTFCRGLRRQVNPTIRRDMTLACADDARSFEVRMNKTLYSAVFPTAIVLLIGFFANMFYIVNSLMFRNSSVVEGVFWGYVYLLPALPVAFSICMIFAIYACKKNSRYSAWAEPVAVCLAAPSSTLIPACYWGIIFFMSHLNLRSGFATISIGAVLFTLATIVVVSLFIGSPFLLFSKFIKSYPYTEDQEQLHR